MSAGAVLNAILDPIFIFGLLGAPALELRGAALATLITRALTLVVALYILYYLVHLMVNNLVGWQKLRRSWAVIVHVGLPAMAANVVVPLSIAVIVMMVARYGTDAVAGLGVAGGVEPAMVIVFYALAGVVGAFFGYN